jgi:transglutaminase-like putative cysteine protease
VSQATIPRTSLAWLLAAQALVMLPFCFVLPVWMIALWLGCSLWRVQMFRMRAAVPGKWLKALMLAVTAVAVYLSSGRLLGLETAAAMLIGTFLLKLLEMHSQRDARVLILLGFFCVVVGYLFDDSLPWALYSVLPVTALLTALIGLQQARLVARPTATLRIAGVLMLQALPLMLLLFVFFPRLPALWSLPMPGNQAQTGLSDSMSAADITELSRSPAVAFRVSFDTPLPARNQLYWRALTLDRYDGVRWSQSPRTSIEAVRAWQPLGPAWQYRIIQEPSNQPWLMALDVAAAPTPDVRQGSDFTLRRQRPVTQPLAYRLSSWPQVVRDPQPLSDAQYRQALQLPANGDPRTRAWAAELQARYPQAPALVQAVLSHFHDEEFHYTLRPQALGNNAVDGFLFDSRRGFCAHFAGAMVYVLRAAGIAARVVAGYQGGELNPTGNFLTVRQYDAHAWVEYWQPGQGWRSVDPTAAVAPQRIESGLAQALAQDEDFLPDSPFSPLRYRNLAWLNELRLGWDSVNYGWQRWVLGYQGEQQSAFLLEWFKGLAPWVLPVGGVLVMSVLGLGLLKPWRRRPEASLRHFRSFERLLARHGLERQVSEGARAFGARAAAQLPAQSAAIEAFVQAFMAQRYAGQNVDAPALGQALGNVRRALARAPRVRRAG